MSRRKRKPPRGWQFWRRAFWTRPALLVFYGIGAGVLGLAFLAAVPGKVSDAIAMPRAAECGTTAVRAEADVDPPTGCLERVPVTLSGPWYRRGPGSEWHLLVERDGRLVPYADADLPTAGSRRLSGDAQADALLWEGTPVAIDLPGQGRIETEDWGHRGWLLLLAVGMFATSALPMLIQAARLKRLTTDGWWSVRGEAVGWAVGLVPSPLMAAACLLAVPSMLAFIPLTLGVGLPWAVGVALFGFGLAIYYTARAAKTWRGRKLTAAVATSPAAQPH